MLRIWVWSSPIRGRRCVPSAPWCGSSALPPPPERRTSSDSWPDPSPVRFYCLSPPYCSPNCKSPNNQITFRINSLKRNGRLKGGEAADDGCDPIFQGRQLRNSEIPEPRKPEGALPIIRNSFRCERCYYNNNKRPGHTKIAAQPAGYKFNTKKIIKILQKIVWILWKIIQCTSRAVSEQF